MNREDELRTELALAIAKHSTGGRWPLQSTVDAARPLASVLFDLFELRDRGDAESPRVPTIREGPRGEAVCG